MNPLANALLLIAILVPAADATLLRAPAFTLTGTFAVQLPDGAQDATLTLDTGQAAHTASGSILQIAAVPDGLRSYRLTFTDDTGAQNVSGEFSAQDVSSLIAAQVQRVLTTTQAAQASADNASATAELALNASLAAQATSQQMAGVLDALAPELARHSDFVGVARSQDVQDASSRTLRALEENAGNQSRELNETRQEVRTLRGAASFLTALVVLALAVVAVLVVRLRADLQSIPTPGRPGKRQVTRESAPLDADRGAEADEPPGRGRARRGRRRP